MTSIPASLSPEDGKLWQVIHPLINEIGLEAALLKYAPSPSLEATIVQNTAEFMLPQNLKLFQKFLIKPDT